MVDFIFSELLMPETAIAPLAGFAKTWIAVAIFFIKLSY